MGGSLPQPHLFQCKWLKINVTKEEGSQTLPKPFLLLLAEFCSWEGAEQWQGWRLPGRAPRPVTTHGNPPVAPPPPPPSPRQRLHQQPPPFLHLPPTHAAFTRGREGQTPVALCRRPHPPPWASKPGEAHPPPLTLKGGPSGDRRVTAAATAAPETGVRTALPAEPPHGGGGGEERALLTAAARRRDHHPPPPPPPPCLLFLPRPGPAHRSLARPRRRGGGGRGRAARAHRRALREGGGRQDGGGGGRMAEALREGEAGAPEGAGGSGRGEIPPRLSPPTAG